MSTGGSAAAPTPRASPAHVRAYHQEAAEVLSRELAVRGQPLLETVEATARQVGMSDEQTVSLTQAVVEMAANYRKNVELGRAEEGRDDFGRHVPKILEILVQARVAQLGGRDNVDVDYDRDLKPVVDQVLPTLKPFFELRHPPVLAEMWAPIAQKHGVQ